MASIQTAIQLADRVSGPMLQILNSVNRTITAFEEMRRASAAPVDTGWVDGTRQDINEATASVMLLQEEIEKVANKTASPVIEPKISMPEPLPSPANGPAYQFPENLPAPTVPQPDPVTVPVVWDTSANLEVFTNSGVERFQQEIQAASSALDTMTASQSNVIRMAQRMEIPPGMMNDLVGMNARIRTIQTAITQLEANPIDEIGADAVNNQLEQLRGQLAQARNAQNQLTVAMERGDISDVLAQYNQLNGTVSRTERQLRDNINGQKGFNQEVRNGGRESEGLLGKLSRVVAVLGLGAAAKSLFTGMFGAAAELEATEAKYNTVFAGMQTTADQFIQEFQKLTPATTAEARSMASGIQDLLVPMGMQRRAATEMTGDMMHLIGALTNFNSATKSTEEVAGAFSSALTGEYDSLKSLGIQVNDTIVKQKAVSMGLAESEKNVNAAAKAQAMYALACEQSRDALAAYNEESLDTTTRLGLLKSGFQDSLGKAGQVLLPKINELLQKVQEHMPEINQAVQGVAWAFGLVVDAASWLFDVVMRVGQFIGDNWSIIAPIIVGIAAAFGLYTLALLLYSAQKGIAALAEKLHAKAIDGAASAQRRFNAAMLASPVTLIIVIIIALIAVIFAVCNAIAKFTGIANSGFGVVCGGVNVVITFFQNLGLSIANIALGIWNALGAVAHNLKTAFQNAILNVQAFFYDLLATALEVIGGIAAKLNSLPFIEFDYSGITDKAADYANKAAELRNSKGEYDRISEAFQRGMSTFEPFQDGWVGEAFASGSAWGDNKSEEISNVLDNFLGKGFQVEENERPEIPQDPYVPGMASDVGAMKDSMELSQEDLKFLREITDRESINRFTTAEIKVDMQNTNQLSSNMDIDGFLNHFGERMEETLSSVALATARG